MDRAREISRRNFIRKTSTGVGAGIVGISVPSCSTDGSSGGRAIARKVSVASIDLKGLWPDKTRESRIKRMLERMEDVKVLHPDLICLPELFDTSWVDEPFVISDKAEDEKVPGPVAQRVAEEAKKHHCYIVCPVVTKKDGHFYNSSILLNRQGEIDGVYHKIHPTDTETLPNAYFKGGGMTPGALMPPVFETDFGIIGMQICMDASWFDNWRQLKEAGAEMVLFPSQGSFGDILSYHAWMNQYYVVSATGEDARTRVSTLKSKSGMFSGNLVYRFLTNK
jgi:predicted amidohydrolase